jgi:hypothetical protein
VYVLVPSCLYVPAIKTFGSLQQYVPNASNTILAVLSNSKNEAIVAMQAPLGTQGVAFLNIAALLKTTQKGKHASAK